MTGEIEFFRKRFVGGFNRQDVVNYISKLAKERNEWYTAKENAEKEAEKAAQNTQSLNNEIAKLNNEIAALRHELERARQEVRESREYKVIALEAAAVTFARLGSSFESLSGDFDTTIESICTEFDQARKTVMSLPGFLARAGDGLKELQAACEAEKKNAAYDSYYDSIGGTDSGIR